MPVLIAVLAVGVAVALSVAIAVLWRRVGRAERTVQMVDVALGERDAEGDLVDRVRGLEERLDAARALAGTHAATLESMPTGVVVTDDTGAVTFANAAARDLIDGSSDAGTLRTRVGRFASRAASGGDFDPLEVEVESPELRIISITAAPLGDDAGGAVAVYLDDVSLERRIEAMRTDFVANASHELKTPLGAIAILAETIGDARDEEQRSALTARLQSEALRMGRLVEDVLQLAETESFHGEFAALSIASAFDEATDAVHARAEDKGISLVREDVVDATIDADRGQIVSAIRNLLDNAITYTAAKGDGGVVRFRSCVDDHSVLIEVEDTGIGIPEPYLDRIFERFFRVDRARSRQSGGTGLGLSIVRNVAVIHGGSVSVRSALGVGSTFTIRLPLAVADTR
jgi:two-component system sensor histidine kinase SenX3